MSRIARILALIVLVASALSASAQIDMKQGDTYTFEFSSLPFVSTTTCQVPNCPPIYFGYVVIIKSNTGNLLVELYENNLGQPPAVTSVLAPSQSFVGSSILWGDRQGAVRFTVQSGTTTISNFSAASIANSGGFVFTYSLMVVPDAASVVPAPRLTMERQARSVFVCWPDSVTNYVLEAKSQLEATVSWSAVTNVPMALDGRWTVMLGPGESARFFRLRRSP